MKRAGTNPHKVLSGFMALLLRTKHITAAKTRLKPVGENGSKGQFG